MNLASFSIVSVSSMSSLGCLVIVRALGNSSLGLYWLKYNYSIYGLGIASPLRYPYFAILHRCN